MPLALVEATPPTVQPGVARAVLELGIKVGEAGEFEARLSQLEELMEQNQSSRRVG